MKLHTAALLGAAFGLLQCVAEPSLAGSFRASSPSFGGYRPSPSFAYTRPTPTFTYRTATPAAPPKIAIPAPFRAPVVTSGPSPFKPASPYNMTAPPTVKVNPLQPLAHIEAPKPFTAPTTAVAGRTVPTFQTYAARPAYASQAFYRGPVYTPGVVYAYEPRPFPWFQFWMWDQAMNHPYGAQYPTGYGPQMGATGSWAASGPAVYDWRRDPCSPRRFFLIRWLFCHR